MMRNPYDMIGRIGLFIAIAGAINWLLVGLFQWNFVQWVFSDSATQTASTSERIVYVVVGVGGLLAIPMLAATLARSSSRDVEYEDRATGEPTPIRAQERVIYRAEEPVGVPSGDAAESTTQRPARITDASLRYGTVEETDEGLDEGMDEQRRAAVTTTRPAGGTAAGSGRRSP